MPPQRLPPQEPGVLTTLGLLYEGNYNEWEDRMGELLELHGYSDSPYERASHMATLMLSHISPALCRRIPDYAQHSPLYLKEILLPGYVCEGEHALCEPFQLLKLPPEVRLRIYAFTLNLPLFEDDFRATRISRETGLALALTSREVRKETKPLWATRCDFTLRLNNKEATNATHLDSALHHWGDALGTKTIRKIRSLTVCLQGPFPRSRNNCTRVKLIYHNQYPAGVLAKILTPDHHGDVHNRLNAMVASADKHRRTLGLNDSAIHFALVKLAPFWIDQKTHETNWAAALTPSSPANAATTKAAKDFRCIQARNRRDRDTELLALKKLQSRDERHDEYIELLGDFLERRLRQDDTVKEQWEYKNKILMASWGLEIMSGFSMFKLESKPL